LIIRNASEEVAKWAEVHLGSGVFTPSFEAWGITDRLGRLTGAIILNDYAERNIELTFVGPGLLKAGVCRELAVYCFDTLKCNRVTVRTRSRNRFIRGLIKKMGARQEGVLRRWFTDDDAVIYGLLREECRYLKGNSHAE
jgi:RimJ/RimL family protein N-acetyltransferase